MLILAFVPINAYTGKKFSNFVTDVDENKIWLEKIMFRISIFYLHKNNVCTCFFILRFIPTKINFTLVYACLNKLNQLLSSKYI